MPQPTTSGFVVETLQWRRLQRRVEALGEEPSPSWLIAVANNCVGISISALITVLVIPSTAEGRLGSGVEPALWTVFVATLLLSAILLAVYMWLRPRMAKTPGDICDEMKTIEATWCDAQGVDLPTGGAASAPERSSRSEHHPQ